MPHVAILPLLLQRDLAKDGQAVGDPFLHFHPFRIVLRSHQSPSGRHRAARASDTYLQDASGIQPHQAPNPDFRILDTPLAEPSEQLYIGLTFGKVSSGQVGMS